MNKTVAILDGDPVEELPEGCKYIGMEQEPNGEPRYGKLFHPWFNKPCYERIKE